MAQEAPSPHPPPTNTHANANTNEQPRTHSPSPSPPPTLPTPLTPGPRAARLQDVYTRSLESTLQAISYASFSACFPVIAAQAPEALRSIHGDLVAKLRRFGGDEFALIMEERAVVERLNALETVIADARRRKAQALGENGGQTSQNGERVGAGAGAGAGETQPEGEEHTPIPPHTLPPKPLLKAHLAPLHRSQQSQLNAKLQTLQSQNASLMEGIRTQRAEIERLLGLGELVVRDLEGAGEEVGRGVGVGEGRNAGRVVDEGRMAEGVLAGMER